MDRRHFLSMAAGAAAACVAPESGHAGLWLDDASVIANRLQLDPTSAVNYILDGQWGGGTWVALSADHARAQQIKYLAWNIAIARGQATILEIAVPTPMRLLFRAGDIRYTTIAFHPGQQAGSLQGHDIAGLWLDGALASLGPVINNSGWRLRKHGPIIFTTRNPT